MSNRCPNCGRYSDKEYTRRPHPLLMYLGGIVSGIFMCVVIWMVS